MSVKGAVSEKLSTRRPWTLSSRLVVGTAALVASVFIVVGIASIATLSSSVTTVVDTQLTGSMSALSHSVEKFRLGAAGTGTSTSGHSPKPFVDYTGHGPGAFIALIEPDGSVADSARFSDEDAQTLDPVAISEIEAADLEVGTHENLELTGIGSYRVATQYDSAGDILVAGASMATADAAVLQEAITIVILGLVAVALIVAGVVVIVRLALRPLGRVVGTAVEVAGLPLDRGDVAIAPRVHASDTDARTEVGKVGEALNLLLAHVDDALAVRAAADKRMRRFVTDASHELRTPLAAIQGYAELTRQDNATLPDITEYSLARIESEAKRMNSLVSDLLLLARLDEGQDLHLDEIDLGEIAVNAVSDARATAPGRRWIVEVPDAPALITGDRERLHQVVLNLLSNAVVHTPDGTSVTTSVSFPDDGTAVELRVSDDGPGIPTDLQPELFERFARGDSSRSRRSGSTGLGLAIVASIVEAHEGHITVESSPEGTTFVLSFARLPGSSPAPRESQSGRATASA